MPSGISNSTVNPAALTPPRNDAQSSQRGDSGAADTQNAQDALAAGGSEVVRAPEASASSQRADNETNTPTGTGQAEQASPGGAPTPPAQQLQAEVDQGIGGNVDITV
jgi:hypothetical protein